MQDNTYIKTNFDNFIQSRVYCEIFFLFLQFIKPKEPMETDINETTMLLKFRPKVVENMLKDHTTQENIYWATDSYAEKHGDGYRFFDPIIIEAITGDNEGIIRPRSVKSREEQLQRSKDKAEVFTPSWICNAQNNLVDEAWFGRKEVFNREVVTEDGQHTWETNPDKISFEGVPDGKDWKDYVADRRLEITCGEAPYLANRYDSVTGQPNEDVNNRIGILDRKLRIVSENTETSKEWIIWGKVALCSTYGFEWQGDNLLLAREALFYTFLEHYQAKFNGKLPPHSSIPGISYIISWNIWQMDGLTYGLPGYKPKELPQKDNAPERDFFPDSFPEIKPHERFCLIKDFIGGHDIHKPKVNVTTFVNDKTRKLTFKSLLEKEQKK